MPMYDTKCLGCGKMTVIFRTIADRDSGLVCPACEGTMQRLISAPYVQADFKPYTCPITDKLIEGRRQHEENLRKHGCRVLEPGESAAAMKAQVEKDEAFIESVAESAAAYAVSLPDDKRQDLERDLAQNFDVDYVRNTATAAVTTA